MPKYRKNLPQLGQKLFLTDGGLETTLIFHDGFELPCFASFDLLNSEKGRKALHDYYVPYIKIARDAGAGMILESVGWRASADWGAQLGYSKAALADANRAGIAMLVELRDAFETETTPIVISGNIGPRGDGYDPGRLMCPGEAEAFHSVQAGTYSRTEADLITAMTLTNTNEAIGVARAAKGAGMPVVIAFTVETDGRLPTGQKLPEAIAEVDEATAGTPLYYMINCAHPTHFAGVLADAPWMKRIRGIRANASMMSHAELDNATELDAGDPDDLGRRYAALRRRFPWINVLGGCCGTDHRHVAAIGHACTAEPIRATAVNGARSAFRSAASAG